MFALYTQRKIIYGLGSQGMILGEGCMFMCGRRGCAVTEPIWEHSAALIIVMGTAFVVERDLVENTTEENDEKNLDEEH